jgi:hypothetical protein
MLTLAIACALAASPAAAKAKKPAPPPTAAVAQTATGAAAEPSIFEPTGRRRAVVLTPQQLSRPIGVKGAPNVATMLSFPEPWAAPPSCGDCIVGGQEPAGGAQPSTLWRIDIFDQTNTIAVKPIAFPGPDLPLTAFEASLDVTLAGGTAVTLFLTLAEVPANADLRIDFKLPEGADAKSRGTALERELRNEFDARLDVAVKEALAETMMAGTKCKDFAGGPRRKDELIARIRQVCRNASYLYVVFEVENGARTDLSLASAVLSGEASGESDFFRFRKDRLLFRERTLGFAALPSADLNSPSSSYTLTITEDGGSQRTLTIEDIDF